MSTPKTKQTVAKQTSDLSQNESESAFSNNLIKYLTNVGTKGILIYMYDPVGKLADFHGIEKLEHVFFLHATKEMFLLTNPAFSIGKLPCFLVMRGNALSQNIDLKKIESRIGTQSITEHLNSYVESALESGKSYKEILSYVHSILKSKEVIRTSTEIDMSNAQKELAELKDPKLIEKVIPREILKTMPIQTLPRSSFESYALTNSMFFTHIFSKKIATWKDYVTTILLICLAVLGTYTLTRWFLQT